MTSEFGSLTSKRAKSFVSLQFSCQFTPMLLGQFSLMSVLYCKQKLTTGQPVQDMFTQTSGGWGSHQILRLWETWACVIQRICNMDTERIWTRKEQLLSTVSQMVWEASGFSMHSWTADLVPLHLSVLWLYITVHTFMSLLLSGYTLFHFLGISEQIPILPGPDGWNKRTRTSVLLSLRTTLSSTISLSHWLNRQLQIGA